MKKKELIFFIIIILLIYFIYKYIVSSLAITSPILNSNDLINNKQVSPEKLYNQSWGIIKSEYIDSTCNSQDWKRWKNKYKGKLKTDEDAGVAIETMLASLDDNYTRFLNKNEYAEQYNSIDSHITGIGVTIMSNAGKITVCGVIDETPAKKANIKQNDIILTVDGKNVSGMDITKVSELIRGKENTTVSIKIQRGKQVLTKKIIRKKIEIKSVESSIRKNNIGYIRIRSFIGTNTSSDFMKALLKLNKTNGLILDLRGNTGGLLTNAVITANMFMNEGNIVSIVSKDGKKRDIKAQANVPVLNKPVILLVDNGSASASEILSGALKDNKKAVLVGTTTFGKGLVQQIVPLPNKTGLNITVAKYLTPNGTDINKKGIEPDYKVSYKIIDLKTKNDTQLLKAEEIMQTMIKHK